MQKLPQETPDLTQQNIDRIAELFPSIVTETKDADGKLKRAINFTTLKQLLSDEVVDGDECYEFTWVGKKQSIIEGNRPIRKTLRPAKDESKNWDTTENLYIEGDNLEVLKLLQNSYLNSIKMIYIDPPYNTGNDFVYRDDFAVSRAEYEDEIGVYDEDDNRLFKNTETNGRFHSDWCSMMYPRLQLARNLLTDDGVIFINIDEHEYVNLMKIMDEVFGDTNDLGTIIWDKRNPKGDAKGISYQHEYIVIYSRNINEFLSKNEVLRPKPNAEMIIEKANHFYRRISTTYTLEDANNDFSRWISKEPNLSGGERAYNKIDEKGNVYQSVSMAWPNKKRAPNDYFIPLIHPTTKQECPIPSRGWRNPSVTMQLLLEKEQILFGPDHTTQPRRKYLLSENMYENIPSLLYFGGSDTELLEELEIPFETPKVTEIVKSHIQSFTDRTSTIIDFFSGSATTAHAVMQLNAEDSGNRKFIMVQLPEPTDEKSEAYKAGYKNICEIGKERIRRAGELITSTTATIEDEPVDLWEGLDTGFRVLKLDSTNMKDVYYSAGEYSQQMLLDLESNIKDDRTDLDLLYGVLLDWGVPLSLPHTTETIGGKKVHFVNETDLVACFEEDVNEAVVREIAKRKPERVVFRDSSFGSTPEKINVTEIFKTLSPDTSVKVI